jgi:peptidoglycan glycosyltransferase
VNRSLNRISIAILAMFLLLMVNLNYLQGFDTTALSKVQFNGRTLASEQQYQRGDIVTSDGVVIAESKKVTGNSSSYKFQRYYPQGQIYAPVTGYSTIYGTSSALEKAYNSLLSGQSSSLAFRNIIDMITNKTRKGATVVTTINSKAQVAAYDGLQAILAGKNKVGGVVAINPTTGAVLADASYPSYDPNKLASLNTTEVNKYDQQLLTETPSPLLNNATQSTFPPGSTFKIITSSAWFTQSANNTTQSIVSSPTTLTLPQTNHVLHNDNNTVCGTGSGTTTLIEAFTESCDTTFAKLGMTVGTGALNTMATNYGFNNSGLTLSGVSTAASNYTMTADEASTAMTAIGQFDDTVTALQEAMLSATIANGGTEMKPYLVKEVQASDLSTVEQTSSSVLNSPVTASVANSVKQMMLSVVTSTAGTANGVAGIHNLGVQVAAKTGTAQNGVNNTGLSDAVFTCFTIGGNSPISVGVIIQGGGFGAQAAAPVAVAVIKAYLGIK